MEGNSRLYVVSPGDEMAQASRMSQLGGGLRKPCVIALLVFSSRTHSLSKGRTDFLACPGLGVCSCHVVVWCLNLGNVANRNLYNQREIV